MNHTIKVHTAVGVQTKKAEDGTNLLDFLYNESINRIHHAEARGSAESVVLR